MYMNESTDDKLSKEKQEIIEMMCKQTVYTADEAETRLEEVDYNYMKVLQDIVEMVCRQTDYTIDEARSQLEEVKYDYMKVLNKFHSIELKPTIPQNISTNQQIYHEIRTLMDAGARQFRANQPPTTKHE
jgi:transposase